jgi:hypothetical protein
VVASTDWLGLSAEHFLVFEHEMRTACSRIGMAPSAQALEPPLNSWRFKKIIGQVLEDERRLVDGSVGDSRS